MVLIKNLIIAIIGIAIALIIYTIGKQMHISIAPPASHTEVATTTPPADVVQEITYRNDTYGIQFIYPEGYVMQEVSTSTGTHKHSTITLMRQEDMPGAENREGPAGIAIDVYDAPPALQSTSTPDALVLSSWLHTSQSNLGLGTGAVASTTVAGMDAAQYTWQGLYQGETTAFVHNDRIIAISVTYNAPEDQNVAVYRSLLQSLQLH